MSKSSDGAVRQKAMGISTPAGAAGKLLVATERFEDGAGADKKAFRYTGLLYHFTLNGRRATGRVYDNETETAGIIGFQKQPSLRFRVKKLLAPAALPYGDPLLAAVATYLLKETPVRHINMLTRAGYVPLDFARAVGGADKGSSGQG
ncbi:MAG TPA: hypothetical protein VM689_26845 [Aliidongia sp.]|nr:hypothetical protein [Aliidongia sp.]